MGLAMLPTFLRVFLLSERRRGLEKRRARMIGLLLGRPAEAVTPSTSQPALVSAQIYTFTPRPRRTPISRSPRALP